MRGLPITSPDEVSRRASDWASARMFPTDSWRLRRGREPLKQPGQTGSPTFGFSSLVATPGDGDSRAVLTFTSPDASDSGSTRVRHQRATLADFQ